MDNNVKELDLDKTKVSRKTYGKLGYSTEQTSEIVEKMNGLLASFNVHYQKLRNFHWNVKGADFFDIHEKLEEQYNYAVEAIDVLAERIRVFGKTPLSTMREYLKASNIKESPSNLESDQMVSELLSDYRMLLEEMFDVLDVAIETGDSGTEDMVKGFIKQIEKNHWMFTAFSEKK